MSFKPKFTAPSASAKPQGNPAWKKDRPFMVLKYKGADDEEATLMAFLNENEGKFGTYFSGKELLLDDDGKPKKDAAGKTMKTETTYFFDAKSLKLKAKIGTETTVVAELKASTKFEGSFFGKNEDGVQFYLDLPKKKK
jgi:hypothetical protein